MAALGWLIYELDKLVVVSGVGVFDLPFLLSYVQATRAAGAVGYCKLLDLRQADIQLSSEDLRAIGTLTRNNDPSTSGPVAILIGKNPPPLMLDMAILLKQRVGTSRRFRLFTDEAEARAWLAAASTSPARGGI
jgi:hypothetical protein